MQEHYSVRELDRQLNSGLFERTILADQQRPFSLQSLPQNLTGLFRDTYVFEFLRLPLQHSEKELQKGLVQHLRSFLLEAGKGFTFVGVNYRVQVTNSDFFIDLLLFHRSLHLF